MNIDSEPESTLPWTGERYLPQITGEIQLEHVHRYLIAREYAKDKDVLDIACGEGFGSAILAQSARRVFGVDIASEAVAHASIRYRGKNIGFQQGSCAAIPLDSASVDLVVSFETIEHHDGHKAMMAEIKRVLRPRGLLIISSPDKKEYSMLPNYRNPFHVRELFREEFEDLLRAYFENMALMSQRIVYGSGILSEAAFRVIDFDIKNINDYYKGLGRARYFIALASDEDLPVLSGGLLERAIDESEIVIQAVLKARQLEEKLSSELSQHADRIRQLDEQLSSQSAQSANKIRQLDEQHRSQFVQFEDKILQLEAEILRLNLSLIQARHSSQSMAGSLSWKVTGPLRFVWDASGAFRRKIRKSSLLSLNVERIAEAGSDSRATQLAKLIGASAFFDADAYEGAADARAEGIDFALHYVLKGEGRGLRPSSAFDPVYYGERYPDIAASDGNRLEHYLKHGRAEGRRALAIAETVTLPVTGIEPALATVVVLIHEASRTGAPILGWNIARALRGQVNIVAVLMRQGSLEDSFADVASVVVGPIGNDLFDPIETSGLARRLAETYRPIYVIANSVETRAFVPALTEKRVPVIALVHEFSSYTKPSGTLQILYERAAEIVFPAGVVRSSSELDYPFLRLRRTRTLPQGPSEVPRAFVAGSDLHTAETERTIRNRLRPEGSEDDLVVVGMGFVDWRKGVDLFIATARSILAHDPKAPVRFIWVGHGYRVGDRIDISCYLSEQVTRSSLGNRFQFMDVVEDVESIYKEADILFLSSRLDPLPNVSIDAALRGIPIVCFAEASGMADILASNEETSELVVAHLDIGASATLIGRLATDRNKLGRLGEAVRGLARAYFDMDAYVAALDKLGRRASQTFKQEDADAAIILAEGAFDPPMYLGARALFVPPAVAARDYVALSSKIDYERIPVSGVYTRRPLAGFNPLTYALEHSDYDRREGPDPLAHYLRAGRPVGSWIHPVLRIETSNSGVAARSFARADSVPLRVLLHGHFHYLDHLGDFVRALAANVISCRLILTTDSTEKAAEIKSTLRTVGVTADIRVVPNRGRDIGAFLTVLEEALGNCDLLGHVHGKRSLGTSNVDLEFGDRWRVFLWQHLLGDEMPMVDIIEKAFRKDPALGLLFPEDPFLVGWEENIEIALGLAGRMGLTLPLPRAIDFPVGTMFWARPEALTPLLRLRLEPDEFPQEPLPSDGTILHALERLLPLVAEEAGYHYATTYLPRFVR